LVAVIHYEPLWHNIGLLDRPIFKNQSIDSQESLTGEDRLRFSGTTNNVTKRNNTDQNLDKLINWQYLLPPIKLLLFYILSKLLQLHQSMELKFELETALTVKCISIVASAVGFTKVTIALETPSLLLPTP
jgi:hypothetical protein